MYMMITSGQAAGYTRAIKVKEFEVWEIIRSIVWEIIRSIIWRNKTNPTNVMMVGRNAIPKPLITFEKSIEKPHKTKKGAVR